MLAVEQQLLAFPVFTLDDPRLVGDWHTARGISRGLAAAMRKEFPERPFVLAEHRGHLHKAREQELQLYGDPSREVCDDTVFHLHALMQPCPSGESPSPRHFERLRGTLQGLHSTGRVLMPKSRQGDLFWRRYAAQSPLEAARRMASYLMNGVPFGELPPYAPSFLAARGFPRSAAVRILSPDWAAARATLAAIMGGPPALRRLRPTPGSVPLSGREWWEASIDPREVERLLAAIGLSPSGGCIPPRRVP